MSRVTTTTVYLRASELRQGMIVSVEGYTLVVKRQEFLPGGLQRVVFRGDGGKDGATWDYRPFIVDDGARWMAYVTTTTTEDGLDITEAIDAALGLKKPITAAQARAASETIKKLRVALAAYEEKSK